MDNCRQTHDCGLSETLTALNILASNTEHARMRKPFHKFFTAQQITKWEPRSPSPRTSRFVAWNSFSSSHRSVGRGDRVACEEGRHRIGRAAWVLQVQQV